MIHRPIDLAALDCNFANRSGASDNRYDPNRMTGWLPPDYSAHGPAIDSLFWWIAGITLFFALLVHGLLAAAMIRCRRQRQAKASGNAGDARLELVWTIVPAVILLLLANASERVWGEYRNANPASDADVATILVIGQQFKWNIIYPGPDGKAGRYLAFPKITDTAWPHRADDTTHLFRGVPGPASLPPVEARQAIDDFISQSDPSFQLGRDFSDPAAADDDVDDATGRTLYLPLNRPVKIQLMSRDVIHDFYLPDFRTQLYAVPGLTGTLTLTPTHLGPAGELICGQLCGTGHSQMHTDVVVLSAEEYRRRFEAAH